MMKKCLIIANTKKEKSAILVKEISEFLDVLNIEFSLFNFDGFSVQNPVKDYDFVITLGGDGTVLYAARCCASLDIPVFPINLGEFGFIAGVQPDSWKNPLENFLAGNAPIAKRNLVSAEIFREKKSVAKAVGLNDIVVSAKEAARTISLDISCNSEHLCTLVSDGAIFATPTGSTAYSASAGGPIIDPALNAIVFTPINAFSLSTRPLVFDANAEIEVKVMESRTNEISMSVDGQKPYKLLFGDVIRIKTFDSKISLAYCTGENFYGALRSKLNWSGGPHA